MRIDSAAVLLSAALLYFVPFELLAAYIISCLLHELCHLAAMFWFKVDILSFRIEARGFVIEHGKISSFCGELICILAGPFGGLLFSFLCSLLSVTLAFRWLELCAAISLILSVFNLLPCLPLDGGKALRCLLSLFLAEQTVNHALMLTGTAVSLFLAVYGLCFWSNGYGYGTAAAGFLLLFSILFEEGIVKTRALR